MSIMKSKSFFIIVLIIASICINVEARRKILKGRKAITRTYHRESIIPAWAIIVLVGLGELILGGILYIIMKIFILDVQNKPRYFQISTVPTTP